MPIQDIAESDDNEKPSSQSLQTIVMNASSTDPSVQLSAVQAARYAFLCPRFVRVLSFVVGARGTKTGLISVILCWRHSALLDTCT